MFDVGIIGGMGPAATAELFRRIVLYTSAQTDQEHIKMCILNDPTIPDRTDYIIKNSKSPLPAILRNINIARDIGCKYFAIPCNTSHFFCTEFEAVRGIEFINMVGETCKYAAEVFPGRQICVLATLGTTEADVYKKIGVTVGKIVYPSMEVNTTLMEIIRCIKAGESNLMKLADRLLQMLLNEFSANETVFVLACTELSLLLPYLNRQFIDAMDVLAGTIISKCCKPINKKTFKLFKDYFLHNSEL